MAHIKVLISHKEHNNIFDGDCDDEDQTGKLNTFTRTVHSVNYL